METEMVQAATGPQTRQSLGDEDTGRKAVELSGGERWLASGEGVQVVRGVVKQSIPHDQVIDCPRSQIEGRQIGGG